MIVVVPVLFAFDRSIGDSFERAEWYCKFATIRIAFRAKSSLKLCYLFAVLYSVLLGDLKNFLLARRQFANQDCREVLSVIFKLFIVILGENLFTCLLKLRLEWTYLLFKGANRKLKSKSSNKNCIISNRTIVPFMAVFRLICLG